MACNIQLIDGVTKVFDDEGNPSQLYKEAVTKFGEETAMEIYLASQSDEFRAIYNLNEINTQAKQALDYKKKINKVKRENPLDFWSVDIPSNDVITKAARQERLLSTDGGAGIVKEDGDIVGVFKYDNSKKNVASDLIKQAISAGGVKLDNFDGYLTKVYERLGFKVVARVEFNEQLAPKGWNRSEHGTPDTVFMAYDPSNSLNIEEKSFRKDGYEKAKNYRDSFVNKLAENNTGKTQAFFSDVVSGKSDKYKAKKAWTPLLSYNKIQETFNKLYSKFKGNFDNHIATSIPTFRETQVKVGSAIVQMLGNNGGIVYDIGGSEGGFIKAITESSNGKITSINLDVNEEMQAAHEKKPVKGSTFVNEAFYESYTDEATGKTYEKHVPTQKADVVHESMVFQFITPKRKPFIEEVKNNYLKSDGILLLEEKLVPDTDAEWIQNENIKHAYKLQYYTQAEITGKAEEVLLGMRKNQTQQKDLLRDLKNNFTYVEEYWDAGNFKGYLATNSKEKRDAFLKELGGKITSEFSSQPVYQEPKLSEVLNFVTSQNQNTEPLNKEQKLELQNFSIGVPNFSTQKLLDAFFDENGMFLVNPQKLKELGLYNDYEISNLQSNVELQQSVKSSLEALKNTTEEIDLNQEEFQQKEVTNDINSFGKMTYLNPYIVQKTIAETLGGTTEQEFNEKLSDLDYPNFQSKINKEQFFQEMQNFAKADVLQEVDGEIKEALNDDTAVVMPQVVKDNVIPILIDSIDTFLNIDQDILDNNPAQVEVLLQSIEDDLVSMGIDVIGMQGKTNIKPFLQTTAEFLINPTTESFNDFISVYDEIFEKDKTPQKTVIKTDKKDREYVKLNTNKSEEQLYTEQGLIKVEDGTYIRVNPKSLEELYAIMQTYPEKFPDENIQEYVQKEVGNMEDIINPEIGEAIFLFKTYFDVVNDAVSEAANDAVNFTGNEQYLTTEFVSDFYIEGLKEKQKDSLKWKQFYSNFGINAQGLYLKNDDPLTMQIVNEFADSNLRNYSLLSKQMPNLKAAEEVEATTLQNRRDAAINNPKSVEKFKGQIYQVTDSEVISKNGNKEFIRINNDIFEAIDTEGQLTLYSKVEKNDSQYNKFNVEQPQTELKLEDYNYLETNPEKFEEIKKNKKLIEENFDCK